jgi:chromosome segregation ATPase
MGLLAFLTSSQLKAELTRQRDEIARIHQILDMEVSQRQEAERQTKEQTQQMQDMESKTSTLAQQLQEKEKALQQEQQRLQKQMEEEGRRLQDEAERKIRDTEVRITTLRQELDEKQRQRADVTDKNSKLAEKSAQLEQRLNEMATAVQQGGNRVRALEGEKQELQKDLDKIMGNLTKW